MYFDTLQSLNAYSGPRTIAWIPLLMCSTMQKN